VVAENGQKRRGWRNQLQFDLIFMDCQDAIMDGYEERVLFRQLIDGKTARDVAIVCAECNAWKGDWKTRVLCSLVMNAHIAKQFHKTKWSRYIKKWASLINVITEVFFYHVEAKVFW